MILITILLVLFPAFQSKLLMVIEVFRHGAREPVYDFWDAKTFREFGELTSVGMHQHYLLGQYIRKSYVEDQPFLSKSYDAGEIYVQSTDLNRTIQSALSHLYGLFPLNEGALLPMGIERKYLVPPIKGMSYGNESERIVEKTFGLNLGFQPVPVLTSQEKDDVLLRPFMWSACPVGAMLERIQKKSDKYAELNEEFRSTFKEIEKIVNATEKMTKSEINMETSLRAYDVFYCDMFYNKKLPENFTEALWRNLSFVADMHLFYGKTGTVQQQRFQCHTFFEEIIEDFDGKLNDNLALKMKIFSAHDLTLAFLLTGLNLTSYSCLEEKFRKNQTSALNCFSYPSFAASLLIELYLDEKNQNPFVMIKYNGEYVNLCEKAKKTCEYSEFKARLKGFMLDDFMQFCKNKTRPFPSLYKYLFD